MGFTLDQLLETTGVEGLARRDIEKVASKKAPANLLKLAERCRQAADLVDEPPAAVSTMDFAEKTAAVQIVRRVLAEIQHIDNGGGEIKTAAPTRDQAVFIKAALEAGHPPEAIARFLEHMPGQPPPRPEPVRAKSTGSIIR